MRINASLLPSPSPTLVKHEVDCDQHACLALPPLPQHRALLSPEAARCRIGKAAHAARML